MTQDHTVKSTKTTFRIVEYLDNTARPRIADIASDLEMPESTVYKHVRTLRELGYVESENGDYTLTTRFSKLGDGTVSEGLEEMVESEIDRLANTTGETAGVLRLVDGSVVLEYAAHGDEADVVSPDESDPLHCSAPGKVLLSLVDTDERESLLPDDPLPTLAQHTLTDPSRLEAELDRVKERRIGFEREERLNDVRGLAVPLDASDLAPASVFVAGPSGRLSGKRLEEDLPGILVSAKQRISSRLVSGDD